MSADLSIHAPTQSPSAPVDTAARAAGMGAADQTPSPMLDFARMAASVQRRVSSGGIEGRTLSRIFAHLEAVENMRLREQQQATQGTHIAAPVGVGALAHQQTAAAAATLDPFARFHLVRLLANQIDIDIFIKQPATQIPLPPSITNAGGTAAAAAAGGSDGGASSDAGHYLPQLSVMEWGALSSEMQLAHVRTSALALRAYEESNPLSTLWSASATDAAAAAAVGASTEQGMLDEAMSGRPCTWIATHQGMLHQSSLTRLPLSAQIVRALSPVEVHNLAAHIVLVASMRSRCAFLGVTQADLEALRPFTVIDRAEKEAKRAAALASRQPKRVLEPEAPFLLFNILETIGRFSVQTLLPHTFTPLPDVSTFDGVTLRQGLGALGPAASAGWAPTNHAGILQHHLGRVMRLSSGNAYRFLLLLEGRGMVAPLKQTDDNTTSGTTGGGGWRWFIAHLAPSAHAAQRASACAAMSVDTPFTSAGTITAELPLLAFQANVASIHSYYRHSCNIKTFRRRLKTEKEREAERVIIARSMLESGGAGAAAAAAGDGDAMLDEEDDEGGEKKLKAEEGGVGGMVGGSGSIPASASAVSMPLVQLRPRLSEHVRGPGPSFEIHASLVSQMYRAIAARGATGMSTPELRAHFNYCFPIKLIHVHVQTLLKQYAVKSMADQTGRSLIYRFFTEEGYKQFVARHANVDVNTLSQHWGAAAPQTTEAASTRAPQSLVAEPAQRATQASARTALPTAAAAVASAAAPPSAESGSVSAAAAAAAAAGEPIATAGEAASAVAAPDASGEFVGMPSVCQMPAIPLSSLEAASVNPRNPSGNTNLGLAITAMEAPLPHPIGVHQLRMAGMPAARTTLKTVTRESLALEYLRSQPSKMSRHTDVMHYIREKEFNAAAADAISKGIPPPTRANTADKDSKTATRLWGKMAAQQQLQQLNIAVARAAGGYRSVLVLVLPDVDLSLQSSRDEALRVAKHDWELKAEKAVQAALEEGRVPEMTKMGTPRVNARSKRTAGSAARSGHRRRNKVHEYEMSGSDESTDRSSSDGASASDDDDNAIDLAHSDASDTDEGRTPGSARKPKSTNGKNKAKEREERLNQEASDPDYFYPLSHGWIRPRMLRLRFILERLWTTYSRVESGVEPVPGQKYWAEEGAPQQLAGQGQGQDEEKKDRDLYAASVASASDLHLAPVSLASVSAAAAIASSTPGDAPAGAMLGASFDATASASGASFGPLPPARCVDYSFFFSNMSLADWLSIVGAVESDMGTAIESVTLLLPRHLNLSISHPDVKPWAVKLVEQQRWRKAMKVRQMFKFAEEMGLVCQARKHERAVAPGPGSFSLALEAEGGMRAAGERAPEDDLIGANYGRYLLQPRVRCMGRVWDLTSAPGRDAYWLALRDACLRVYRVRRAHKWAGNTLTPKQLEAMLVRERPTMSIAMPPSSTEGAEGGDASMTDGEAPAEAAAAFSSPVQSAVAARVLPADLSTPSLSAATLSAGDPRSSLAPEQLLVHQYPVQRHSYLYNVKQWSLGPPLPQHVVDAISNLSVAQLPPPSTFIDEIARGFECRRAMVAVQLARKRYPFVENQVQQLQQFDSGSRDLFTHDRFNRQVIPKRGKGKAAGAAAEAGGSGSGSATKSGGKRKRGVTKHEDAAAAAAAALAMEEEAYDTGVAHALRPEDLTPDFMRSLLNRAALRAHGYGGDLYTNANISVTGTGVARRGPKPRMFSLIREVRHPSSHAPAAASPASSAAPAAAAAAAAAATPESQKRPLVGVTSSLYDDSLGLGDGAGDLEHHDMDHQAGGAAAAASAASGDDEDEAEEEGDEGVAASLGATPRGAAGRTRPFRPRNRWSASEDDVLVSLYNEWLVSHYEPWLKLQQQPVTREELDRAARRSLASVIPTPAGADADSLDNVPQGLWAGAQVHAVMAAHSAQRAPLVNVNNFISSGMVNRNADAVRRRIEVLRLKARLPTLAALSGAAVPAVHRSLGFQALSTHVFPHPSLSSLLSLVKMVLSQSGDSYNARQAAALIHHFQDQHVDVVLKSLKTDRWITQTKSNQNQLGRSYKFAAGWAEHMKPQGVAGEVFAAARESIETWMALHGSSSAAAAVTNPPSRFSFDVHSRGGDLAAMMALVSEGRARLVPCASDAASSTAADHPERVEVGVDVESVLQPIVGADEEREENLPPLVSTLPQSARAPLSFHFLRSNLELPFSAQYKVDIPTDESLMLNEDFLLPAPTPHSPATAALLQRMRGSKGSGSGSSSGSAASSPARSRRSSVADDVDMTAAAAAEAAPVPDPLLMSTPSVGNSGAPHVEAGTHEAWLDTPEVIAAQRTIATLLDSVGPDGVEWPQLRSLYLEAVAKASPAQPAPVVPLAVTSPLHEGCSVLEKALARATSLLEVLRVSAHEAAWRYVHARYCQLWCVPTFHEQAQGEVKADFTDTALTAHPWRSLDGGINQPLFQSFQQVVLSLLLSHPGMSVSSLQRHLPVVSPAELEQLLAFLVLEDKITERIYADQPVALFSQPFGFDDADEGRRRKRRKTHHRQRNDQQTQTQTPSQRYLFPTTHAFAL